MNNHSRFTRPATAFAATAIVTCAVVFSGCRLATHSPCDQCHYETVGYVAHEDEQLIQKYRAQSTVAPGNAAENDVTESDMTESEVAEIEVAESEVAEIDFGSIPAVTLEPMISDAAASPAEITDEDDSWVPVDSTPQPSEEREWSSIIVKKTPAKPAVVQTETDEDLVPVIEIKSTTPLADEVESKDDELDPGVEIVPEVSSSRSKTDTSNDDVADPISLLAPELPVEKTEFEAPRGSAQKSPQTLEYLVPVSGPCLNPFVKSGLAPIGTQCILPDDQTLPIETAEQRDENPEPPAEAVVTPKLDETEFVTAIVAAIQASLPAEPVSNNPDQLQLTEASDVVDEPEELVAEQAEPVEPARDENSFPWDKKTQDEDATQPDENANVDLDVERQDELSESYDPPSKWLGDESLPVLDLDVPTGILRMHAVPKLHTRKPLPPLVRILPNIGNRHLEQIENLPFSTSIVVDKKQTDVRRIDALLDQIRLGKKSDKASGPKVRIIR